MKHGFFTSGKVKKDGTGPLLISKTHFTHSHRKDKKQLVEQNVRKAMKDVAKKRTGRPKQLYSEVAAKYVS